MAGSVISTEPIGMRQATVVTDSTRPMASADLFAGLARSAKSAKIMIVDDEPINIKVVSKYLKDFGFQRFVTTNDSTQAMRLVEMERPDAVLLDIVMPAVTGLEILKQIRAHDDLRHTPVLILTASTDGPTKTSALLLGATDFLGKPVEANELVLRVRNALFIREHQTRLEQHAEELESLVRLRTKELIESREEVIHCLARAAEFRDGDTGLHILRVGRFAKLVGQELGLGRQHLDILEQAATLHDVGKIGIPDAILLKPGRFEPDEFKLMQMHCEIGRRILLKLPVDTKADSELHAVSASPVLQLAAVIAQTHHEKWDGSGYPRGLSGENIPIEGRITAVVDMFDALTNERPYKRAFSLEKSLSIIASERGKHFDPRVVDAFFARQDQIMQTRLQYRDQNTPPVESEGMTAES